MPDALHDLLSRFDPDVRLADPSCQTSNIVFEARARAPQQVPLYLTDALGNCCASYHSNRGCAPRDVLACAPSGQGDPPAEPGACVDHPEPSEGRPCTADLLSDRKHTCRNAEDQRKNPPGAVRSLRLAQTSGGLILTAWSAPQVWACGNAGLVRVPQRFAGALRPIFTNASFAGYEPSARAPHIRRPLAQLRSNRPWLACGRRR